MKPDTTSYPQEKLFLSTVQITVSADKTTELCLQKSWSGFYDKGDIEYRRSVWSDHLRMWVDDLYELASSTDVDYHNARIKGTTLH